MMLALLSTASLLVASSARLRSANGDAQPTVDLKISPVTTVKATKYLGRWYQMYSDSFITNTFEYDSFCDTADYALNTNGTISVHNRERVASVTGQESGIYGYATEDASYGGILTVYLQGVPAGAPYWIFKLGSSTYGPDGLYQYAVVSDPLQLSLFVLARNVTDFYANYNQSVYTWLTSNGWNSTLNTPEETGQLGCKYWD